MHELSLMEDLVTTIEQSMESGRVAGRIAVVHLDIGKLSAVIPDALQFCFEICAKGTALEGAELRVRQLAGRARCKACGVEREIDLLPPPCSCGSIEHRVVGGEELRLAGVEVI